MAKAPTLRKRYEDVEKFIQKQIKKNPNLANAIKIPKKPKTIRRKHIAKIEETRTNLMKYASNFAKEQRSKKAKEYWRKLKEDKPEIYEQRKKQLSKQSKEYWRKLKEQNPQEFDRRIKKLQEGRNKSATPREDVIKPKTETIFEPKEAKIKENPDIGTTEIDLEEIVTEEPPVEKEEIYEPPLADFQDLAEEKQKEIKEQDQQDIDTLDTFFTSEEEFKEKIGNDDYAKIIIFNFIKEAIDVYNDSRFSGAPYAIRFVSMLVDTYGTDKTAYLLQRASEELGTFQREMLYDPEDTLTFENAVMDFLYNYGILDDIQEDMDEEDIKKFMDNLKKMQDEMTNSDEVFTNYD